MIRLGQGALEHLTLRLKGDHQLRKPRRHLITEGFTIDTLEHSKWGIVQRLAARTASVS